MTSMQQALALPYEIQRVSLRDNISGRSKNTYGIVTTSRLMRTNKCALSVFHFEDAKSYNSIIGKFGIGLNKYVDDNFSYC